MITSMETTTRQQLKDIKLIGKFVEVYCAGRHGAAERLPFKLPAGLGKRCICQECALFMTYAIAKRMKCPLEAEKPSCKHCRIHCYGRAEREKAREIMAYSGRKLIMRGRLDYVWHYLF